MPENIVIPLGFDASSLSPTVIRAVNEAQSRIREIKLKVDSRPLGTISRDLTQFDRSLEASNARVLAFGASVGIISAVAGAFKSLVSSTIEVEKRLTDIQVVLQASSQNFVKFTDRLFDVAKATGQSFETVATAATEFSRQGLGIPEILKRTNDALILSRLSGLSAAEAVQDLTAAINTFKSSAVDSTAVINKLATVDAAFAVSSADLAEAIKRTGSAAEDAKVSLDELVAIVTSAQQTTARGGAVIGNAFKTIFTRLGDSSTLDALEELNIKVRDIRGNALPALQVLQNLANRFDTLSDSQQNATAKLVGGLFQINVLRASLGDLSSGLSVYERALDTSTNAVDEAIKRNEALNTTFSSLLNKTQVNLKQFFANVGKQTFEPIGKNAFNLFNALFDSSKGAGTNGTQSKSFGQKVGQGLINGVSDFLKGPAIVVVGALLYKLFANAFTSAQGAFKSVIGFNSATERQKNIQEGINRVLASGNTHYQQRLAAARSVAEQEQVVLDILRQENAILSQRKGVNAAVAANLVGRVSFPNEGSEASIKKPGFASGYVPSIAQEVKAVRAGVGGASPSSKPVEIKGFNFGGGKKGDVVANTSEYLVDNFKGGDGTAVFNPEMVKKVGGIANLNKLGKVRKVNAATGYIPNYAEIPLVGKFYDTLKVGYGLQPSPDGGVEQRRLLGGIGFSSTPEAKEAGAASAVRGANISSFLNNALRDHKEAAFVPFISHKNVAYPIGGGLLTNEALFSHALATLPNREKTLKKMMTSGDDVFKVLREHSGADMMKLVEQYFLKTKTGRAHLMQAAREIEEPRLAPFFMPDGKVSNIQKGAFAFNSARLIKRDGVFSHKNEGTHLSYPFLINGRTQAESIAPVEFNELFDKSNTSQNSLAAAQRFAVRMLNTNVKNDRKILEKIGFSQGFVPGWKHVPNYASFRGLSEKQVTANLSRDAIEGDFFKNFYRQYRDIHPLEGAERARFSAIYAGQSGGVSDSHVFKTSVGIYDRFRNLTGDAKHDPYQYFDFLRSFGQGTNPFIQEGRKRTVFPLPKDIPPSELPKFVQQLAAQSSAPLRDAFRVVNLGNALRGIPPTSKKFGPYYHALEGNPVPPVDRHVIGSALGAKQALEEDDLKITKSEIAVIQSAMDRAVGSKKLSNLGFEDKAQLQAAIYGARSLQAGRNVPDIKFFKNQLGRLSMANGHIPNYAQFNRDTAKRIADIHNEFGGVSYNLRAGNLAGREAYALSLFPELSKIVPKQILTPDEIEEFYGRNKKLLNHPLSVLGGWYDGTSRSSYLDVSTATSNRELAVRAARMANQKAIFDLSKFEEIPIGGDGAPVAGLTKGLGRLHQLFGKGAAQYGFAQGFVPNYAKTRLGQGLYGIFYDLGRKLDGARLGKKEFYVQDSHIGNDGDFNAREEFVVSKVLEGLNGQVHPLLKAPRVFGSLKRSGPRLGFGKEVIGGLTGKQFFDKVVVRDFSRQLEGKPFKYERDAVLQKVLTRISKGFARQQYTNAGIELNDLHGNNYMLNPRAQGAILQLTRKLKQDSDITRLSDEDIADFIAKRGGRLSVIDAGVTAFDGDDSPARELSRKVVLGKANGFIPNYALKSMGAGKYGEFFDTGKTIGGVRVGVKKFFPVDGHIGNTGAENAEQEFMVSKLLEKLNGTVHPLYQAPRIFGSLRRAKEKMAIGKEIMSGLTGDDLVKKIAKEDRNAFLKGGGEQVDRASTVRQINKAIAGGFGAESYDYLGLLLNDFHSQNYILNDKAQKEIVKMSGDFADPYDVVNENAKDLADRIAKAGGRLSLIDAGLAEVFPASKLPARKIVNKYFPYGGLASGYVPNYAKDPLEAAIEREKAAGLPESQIYVDHVKTPRYSGPVVANKRDEPNRSALLKRVNSHPNPAMAGVVPNYADTKLTRKEKAELRKEIYEALKHVQTENARRAAFARFEDPTQQLQGSDVGHVGDALLRQFFNDSGVGHYSNDILQQATPKLFKAGQAHVAQQLAHRQFRADLQQAVVREQRPRGFLGDILGSYGIERRINAATTPTNDADKLTRLNTVNQLRQERTSRLQNRGFQASFLIPAVAGQIQSFAGVDPESRRGRIASGITSAVSGGVSVAALAPGPAGLAIGGLIATFGSLKAVTANLKDNFEVFSGKLRDNVNVVGERSTSVANVLQAQSNLQDVVQNGGSPAAITAARAQLNQLITDVPKKLQDKVREAVDKNDTNALLKLTGQTSLQKSRAESVAGALSLVSKENEKNGLFRDKFANIVGPSRINSVAAQQGGFVDLLKKGEFGSAIARAQLNVADLVTTDKRPRSLRDETVKAFTGIQTGFDDKEIGKFSKILNEKGSGVAFESILKDIGFNKENRKNALDEINAAAGGNAEEQKRIFDDIVRIMLTQSKAASQTAKNYEASVIKTKKINDLLDIFSQQVAANYQVGALARQNRRELAVSGIRGLADANRQTLSKSFQNKLDYDIGRLELRNNTQRTIAGLNTGLISALPSSIPASLDKSDEVRRGFVNRVTSISQNPTASGAQELLKFIDSNTEGKSRDQETKNLQSELTKYASSLQELAVNNEQQLRVLEQQKVLAEQSLRAEERASVFGGDFRRMKDYDFSTVRQGLSAGSTLNARGSSPRFFIDQGYFDNFFHPRYDTRRNNEITRDRQRRQAEGSLELLNQGLLRDPKNIDAVRAQVKEATKGQLLNNIDTLLRDRNLPASFRRDLLNQRKDVDNIAEEQSRRLVPVSEKSKNALNAEIQKNLETARVSTRVEDNIQIVAAESRKTAENTLDIANTLRALAGATGASQTELTQSAATNKAAGHLPNMIKEAVAIRRGIGGALPSDRPLVKNVSGLGNVVVNSGERVIQNFLGTGKGAILTRDMQRSFSRGYVPNFADVEPIFGKGIQKRLRNANQVFITDAITEEEDALRKMGLGFKARIAKVQSYLFNRTVARHGGQGVPLEKLGDAIEASTPKGAVKSRAFYFSPQAEGGLPYIQENFKKGQYFAPNLNITKYKEAVSSRYMPQTFRLDKVLRSRGLKLSDIVGGTFPDHVLKPISEGIQSQGIFRPGDIIQDYFVEHGGKVNKIKPNDYIVQQAYKLASERSISKFLFSGGVGSYLRSSRLEPFIPEFLLRGLTTTGADYSHFFQNAEYRTHIATDEGGTARAVRYATANKNSPIRSMFANFYESAKIKAIQEAGRRAVQGLPRNLRRGGQLFGPDIAALDPKFAEAENARLGFEKFPSYQRSFLERVVRGRFSEKVGYFGALELNPTKAGSASGNLSHGLELDAVLSQAKGKLPSHALDQRLKDFFTGGNSTSVEKSAVAGGFRLNPQRFQRAFLAIPSAIRKAASSLKPTGKPVPTGGGLAPTAAMTAAVGGPSILSKLGPLWYQLAGYQQGGFGKAVGNALTSGSTFSNVYGSSPRSVSGLIGGAVKGGLFNPVKDSFGIVGNSFKAITGIGGRGAALKGLAGNAFGLAGKALAGLAIAGGAKETFDAASRGDVIGRNVAAGKTLATAGALSLSAGAGIALSAGSAIGSQISKYGIGGIGGFILDKAGVQEGALRDYVDAAKDSKLTLNFAGDVLGGAAAAFGAAREAKAAGIKNSGFLDIINPFSSKRAYSDALSKEEIGRIDDESFERRVRFFAEKGRTTGLSEKMQQAVNRFRKERGLDGGNAAPVAASKPSAPASTPTNSQPDYLAALQRAEAAKMERQLAEAEQAIQRQKQQEALNNPNAIGIGRNGAILDTAGPQYFSSAVTGGETPGPDGGPLPYFDQGRVNKPVMLPEGAIGVGRNGLIMDKPDNGPIGPTQVTPTVLNRVALATAANPPTTTSGALEKAYAEKLKKQEEEFRKNGYTNRTVGYQSFAEGFVPNFSVLGSTGGLSRGAYGISKRGRSLARRAFDSAGTARHSKSLENLILSGMIGGEVGGQNLQAAIEREREALQARGYYASGLIQVGYSPRIGGLGVYNRIDEPFGLEQGVDRVIRQGGNPMKSGQVPNFAESIEKLNGAIEKLGSTSGTGSSSTVDVLHNHNVQLSLGGEIRSSNAQVASITNEEFAKMKESLEARIRELELATSKTNKGFFLRPESV